MKITPWIAALLLSFPAPAMTMDFQSAGTTLVLSGHVADGDLARLKDALAPGEIRLVVLGDSTGGDLWNGLNVGELIREQGLPTVVAGRCASACALIFLGGTSRAFAAAPVEARLGFHGAHSRSTKAVSLRNAGRLRTYIERMTGGKYTGELLDKTVYIRDSRDIVYVYHPAQAPAARGPVAECLVGEDGQRNCTPLQGFDALSLGVVTTLERTALTQQALERLRPLRNPAPGTKAD
jgi:ATP-dependent protease ClpP protease subunit